MNINNLPSEVVKAIEKFKRLKIIFTEPAQREIAKNKEFQEILLKMDKKNLLEAFSKQKKFTIKKEKTNTIIDIKEDKPTSITKSTPAIVDKLPPETIGEKVFEIFTEEQIARLKLQALTSVDINQKIEAIRKIYFAPIKIEEKILIYLKLIFEPFEEVRREVASGLKHLGFNYNLCNYIEIICSESPLQKRLALQKISGMYDTLSHSERNFAAAFLISQLKYERHSELHQDFVEALGSFVAEITGRQETWLTTISVILKTLSENYKLVNKSIIALFEKIRTVKNPDIGDLFWKEIKEIKDPKLSPFLFALATMFLTTPDYKKELAHKIAQILANVEKETPEIRFLLEYSKQMKDVLVEVLIEEYPSLKLEARPFYLSVIDSICSEEELSPEALYQVGEFYLGLLKEESREVRQAIIEGKLCCHPKLNHEIKKKIAKELIYTLHLQKAPYLFDLTTSLLVKMGDVVLDALKEALVSSPYEIERKTSCNLIAEILYASDVDGKIKEHVDFLKKLEDGSKVSVGEVVKAIGKICANKNADSTMVEQIYKDYRSRIGRVSYNLDVLDSLTWIVIHPQININYKVDTLLMFMKFLEGEIPEFKLEEKMTADGARLTFDPLSELYVQMTPILLKGIQRIMKSQSLPPGIYQDVVNRLIQKWSKLISYQEIWAPNCVIMLAETLGEITKIPGTDIKTSITIIRHLCKELNNTSIINIIGDIFWNRGYDEPEYLNLTHQIVKQLLKLIDIRYYREPQDVQVVIVALGKIALNKSLAPDVSTTNLIRTRIVDLLIENYSLNFRAPRILLERLLTSPDITEEEKQKIENALKRM